MIIQNFNNLFEDRGTTSGSAYSQPTTPSSTQLADASLPTVSTTQTPAPAVTIQVPPMGFGSYLNSILPPDIAQAAGAFSTSMLQIKNIKNVPIEKFAQIVTNIETTTGLSVNSTSVPVDTSLATQGSSILAKGSGPYGTYTMSDFMGCMSGLPYLGLEISGPIHDLETTALYNIYKQLYLAVTWERATVSVQYSTYQVESPPTIFTTYYHVTGLTITDPGGGYGREGASAPTITISDGGSGTTTIGLDDTDLTNFGRVTTVSLSSAGTDGTTVPTATVDYPPGGTSFSNTIVQDYIDGANVEIANILASKPALANKLNTNWNYSGTQLTIEQRAIATGQTLQVPLASPSDKVDGLSQYPTTIISFIDNLPQFGLNTEPNMQAQTIEAISNLSTVGGQSIVALMRAARNQARLAEVGIPLDDNIEDTLSAKDTKELIANGTVGGSTPAKLVQTDNTTNVTPNAYGFYNPVDNNYYVTNPDFNGTQLGTVVDTGSASVPGSFAGSDYGNLVPSNLNAFYSSGTLLPSTYTISQAIDEVVTCNCDCWDLV